MIMYQNQSPGKSASTDQSVSGIAGQDKEFQDLELAFLGSLVPGIIHNMATPLSGVLGATQLLEKRASQIGELLADINRLGEVEQAELLKHLDRNRTNVDILARNAKHLADILQCLVQRITRGSSSIKEYHSLNELLQNELRFLEANLTFKHKVKKQVSLGEEITTIKYVYGYVATTIDEFVTSCMAVHDAKNGMMEMDFMTVPGDGCMTITIEARYPADEPVVAECGTLACCFDLLRGDGWTVEYECMGSKRRLNLHCPKLTVPA
jgi:hypothetical protein